MQIAVAITRHCPFVLESDMLSLSPDFRLGKQGANDMLHDAAIGVSHRLVAPGGRIMWRLVRGASVAELRVFAKSHQATDMQLTEVLGFLSITGGLVRKRKLSAWPHAVVAQGKQYLHGIRYYPAPWRRHATAGSLLVAIYRACRLIIAATLLLCLLQIGASILSPLQGALVTGFGLAVFIGSVFAHEYAHLMIIRRHRFKAAVLQRGMRLGIIHHTMSPQAEIYSALAGPAVGMATGILCGIAALPYSALLALLGVCIGMFHGVSLLPWYGDGASLRRATRIRRTRGYV